MEPKNKTHSRTAYDEAGVSVESGYQLVSFIKKAAKKTQRPEVLGGIGGFSGLFQIPVDRFKEPVLVSGTDGVGTKLKIATAINQHHTIGIDLVAMCVNDIITVGAEPLFFLDYFATGKIEQVQAEEIITGIITGCEIAGATLIGGETAEMPGFYQKSEYDLAGFCVGIVEKQKIIDRSKVKIGNVLIGIASSGFHSNGYSLIRHILEKSNT